jgi:hypothetical protein
MKTFMYVLLWAVISGLLSCNNQQDIQNLGLATIKDGRSNAVSSHAPGFSN